MDAANKLVVKSIEQGSRREGIQMDPHKREEAARAVAASASASLERLAQWRSSSLERAATRMVGPGSP